MNIDKIVKAACALSAVEFNKAVENETARLIAQKGQIELWAQLEALQTCLPSFVENAMKLALEEILPSANRAP